MRPTTRTRHQTRSHRPSGRAQAAQWRTSTPDRSGHGIEIRPALFVCLVLASGYGRGLRMLAGALLIGLGAAAGGGFVTTVFACVGLVAMLEAMFDLCLAAPLLGCPANGASIRRRAALTL